MVILHHFFTMATTFVTSSLLFLHTSNFLKMVNSKKEILGSKSILLKMTPFRREEKYF